MGRCGLEKSRSHSNDNYGVEEALPLGSTLTSHFSSWDELRGILQFECLLVNKLALLWDHSVWVQWAHLSVGTRVLGLSALTRWLSTTKAELDLLDKLVTAIAAIVSDSG